MARRRELIREAERGDAAAEEDLAVFENRYHLVSIPEEHRLTLKAEWLRHLGLAEKVRSRVYIERVFDRIVIMSKEYRDQRLRVRSQSSSICRDGQRG